MTISTNHLFHSLFILSSSAVEQSAVNRLVVGSNPTWGVFLFYPSHENTLRVGLFVQRMTKSFLSNNSLIRKILFLLLSSPKSGAGFKCPRRIWVKTIPLSCSYSPFKSQKSCFKSFQTLIPANQKPST